MDDIDESWTQEFRGVEGPYDRFYKEKADSVKLFFMYVNDSQQLVSVKSERIMLDAQNLIKRETLCGTIKSREICDGIRYKLCSLLRFNIDAEPEDALEALEGVEATDYMHHESYMDNVHFQDTICTFQDLNSLFFLFREATKANRKGASRRIFFKTLARKTRRKRA